MDSYASRRFSSIAAIFVLASTAQLMLSQTALGADSTVQILPQGNMAADGVTDAVLSERLSRREFVLADGATPAALRQGGASLKVVSNADRRQPVRGSAAKLLPDGSLQQVQYNEKIGSGAYRDRPTWANTAARGRQSAGQSTIRFSRPSAPRATRVASNSAAAHPISVGPKSELVVRATDLPEASQVERSEDLAQQVRFVSAMEQDGQFVVSDTAETPAQSSDVASQSLVQAHELSQSASGQSDYSRIIGLCAKARQLGAEGEAESFARELTAWALNRRGQERNDEGQFELAMADFEAALETDSENWRALHNRGVTFAQNGQFAEAFDDFSRVIQLSPQFPKAYSNRATLYVQAGQVENALNDFQRALLLDESLFAAHVGRGRMCHQLGRLQEALEHMNAAIEIDGQQSEVICSRADLHADLGNYADALSDYARAIDLKPDFAHAYRNGAWLLATCPDKRFRDAENAIAGAKQALEFGYGERHAALDTLAAALASDGQFDEARKTVQQAIEVAPDQARGAYQVRLKLYEAGQPFRIGPPTATAQ